MRLAPPRQPFDDRFCTAMDIPKEVGGHMDLDYVLRILHGEKQKLERVIASLEQLLAIQAIGSNTAVTAKKRGLKSISEEERRKVSARMKRFWTERKKR
jgi:hypothetical protein